MYEKLVQTDPGFYQIFNMSISLLNDLFSEIPENFVSGLLKKFLDSGFIKLIDEKFLHDNIPCDFDVLSFYIKFCSLIHLHHKNTYTQDIYFKNIDRVFEIILYKKIVCNNIRRYLSSYVNETLKNLTEELLMSYNVHPHVSVNLNSNIKNVYKKLTSMENLLVECMINSNNKKEFWE